MRAAGYCPIDFDLDYSGGLPTAAQAASGIARQARSGGCIAYLGADTAVQADWSTLLSRLRSSSRLITALNELQRLYNGKSLVEDGAFAIHIRHAGAVPAP